ncbi:hypothetical protein BDZ45DRAFT_801811 [Acephala macrosclerotiorum]|nr:hypothetical protein BDZ45DRAFT_801811 [Acephala macrosclerotiorum]
MIIVSLFTFHETYDPVILQHRAKRLRRERGNQQYHTESERHDSEKSLGRILRRALSRPLRLLAFHPIIQVTAIISGFNYGLLTSSCLPSPTSGFGNIIKKWRSVAYITLLALWVKWPLRRLPEFRIPLMFPGIIIAPLGLLLYGWSAQHFVQWAVVDIGRVANPSIN